MTINETVLEMHFHKPLMDLFRETFGVEKVGKVNFYKYSPQKEVFIGFDQAYAMTELSDIEFFQMLKESAANASYKLPKKFLAYFLQFKVVRQMVNIQKHTPKNISAKPHYRSTLDTKKNQTTGFSQHELLYKLSHNDGAMVYYACPMLFDKSALYAIDVDLDQLRLADLLSCPSKYSDNEAHYVYFNAPLGEPIWCSEPVAGKAFGANDFVRQVMERLAQLEATTSAEELLRLLSNFQKLGISETSRSFDGLSIESAISLVHDSLTIIELEPPRSDA
jgi:hypothetical protein